MKSVVAILVFTFVMVLFYLADGLAKVIIQWGRWNQMLRTSRSFPRRAPTELDESEIERAER